MNDPEISMSKAVAFVAWSIMAMCALVALVVFAMGHQNLGLLIGIKALLWSAVAAVLTIRCWTLRVCRMIRASAGLDSQAGEVHPIR